MSKETKEAAVIEEEKSTSASKSDAKSNKQTTSKLSENNEAKEDEKETEPETAESDDNDDKIQQQEEIVQSKEIVDDEKTNTELDTSGTVKSSSVDILPLTSEDEVKFAVRGKDYKLHIYDNRLGTQIKTVAFGAVTAVINKNEPSNKVLVYADPSCSKESVLGWANISDLIAL